MEAVAVDTNSHPDLLRSDLLGLPFGAQASDRPVTDSLLERVAHHGDALRKRRARYNPWRTGTDDSFGAWTFGQPVSVATRRLSYHRVDPLRNLYWAYGRANIGCEMRLLAAYREKHFPMTSARLSLTYDTNFPIAIGGWGCYTLAQRMLTGWPIIVHGDGSSLWVVTHAADFARGFIGLIGNPRALGHACHITSDDVLTWNQICAIIAEALGAQANVVHIPSDFIAHVAPELGAGLLGDKTWSVVFDNSTIKSFVPGFQTAIPFREGIRRTLARFDAIAEHKRVEKQVDAEMDRIISAYNRFE